MSDVLSDLQYRVVQIQVFLGDGCVKGWSFKFRHWRTKQEALEPNPTTAVGSSTREDVDLMDHEFLVGAKVVTGTVTIKGTRADAVVTGLEFITSAGRTVRVGSSWAERSAPKTVGVNVTREVRTITAKLTHQKQAIRDATPKVYTLPTREELATAAQRLVSAAASKCHHERECSQLEETAVAANSALQTAFTRGVVVPVAAFRAFVEVAANSEGVLLSCGRSAVTWRGKRKPALLEYTGAMAFVRDFALLELPAIEFRTLDMGDAVGRVTSETMPTMVRNAITSSQAAIAAKLFAKYAAAHMPAGDKTLVHEVIKGLLPTQEKAKSDDGQRRLFSMVREVVEAYAGCSNEPVATILDAYRTQQAALCEHAVHSGDAVLLHWLVVKALTDPFDDVRDQADVGTSQALVAFSASSPEPSAAHRRSQYERLIALVARSGAAEDARAEMRKLLTVLMEREEFQRGMLAIAVSDKAISSSAVMALVPKITSVYDLGYLAPVATSVLSTNEMKRFFRAYCDCVVQKRLVQMDDDCAFFNTALRQAETRGFIEMYELERLRIDARHINTESAPYIRELKHAMRMLQVRLGCLELQVKTLGQSVTQLVNVLRLKEVAELRRVQVRRAVALVASILYVVGGQVIQASHDMFESWNVTAMLGDGLALDMVDPTKLVGEELVRDALLDSSVRLVLAHANVNEDDFVAQLHAAVLTINQARLTTAEAMAAPTVSMPQASQARRVVIAEDAQLSGTGVASYHAAVLASGGDLERFKTLERTLLANNVDINARAKILVEKRRTSRLTSTMKTKTSTRNVPAHVYASHLGYRAIVDHLLRSDALRKRSELAFVTKWRARRVAKMQVEGAPAA